MNTKLTLRLDSELIDSAKNYAAHEGRSVSELVAAYFYRLSDQTAGASAAAPTSSKAPTAPQRKSSFYGLLKGTGMPAQGVDESDYRDHLAHKHQ